MIFCSRIRPLTLALALGFAWAPTHANAVLFGDYLSGTTYEPDWWPRSYWSEDFRKMHELGFNVVRMTEFSWATLEPEEGRFDFGWLDEAVNLAQKHGIAVILTTPTAALPPWLYKKHPDVLSANDKGPFTYGGRKGAALESPAYRRAADHIITAMARHYAANTNVIGWQINNEPGFPFASFDDHSLAAFRNWLKQRYGTITRLNASWGGAFWSNQYNHWDEIQFPYNSAEGGWRPGSNLDYRRFFSDMYLGSLGTEISDLRPHLGGRFCFANWPDTLWSVDVFQASGQFAFTAWDNYANMPGMGDFNDQFYAGLNHDLSRCAGPDQQFIVAEQLARAPANADPRGVRLQTLMGLAHGSHGTIFYEWRPPLAGNEAAYPSVLNLDGSVGPEAEECRRLNDDLSKIAHELKEARTESDLAMIFSYDNQWDQGFWNGNTFRSKTGYDGTYKRYYAGMKVLHRNVDVVPPGRPLDQYRMVVAPGLQMVSDETAAQLNQFVSQGGILVLNLKAGTRRPDGQWREAIGPGVFAKAAGVSINRFGTFRGITNEYFVSLEKNAMRYKVAGAMEGVGLRGAEVAGKFTGRGMEDNPAVTINRFGKGFVVYVAAEVEDQGFYSALFAGLAERFQIPPLLPASDDVEVVSRSAGGNDYFFLLNLGDNTRTIRTPLNSVDLINKKSAAANVSLAPFETVILKVKSKQ